MQESFLNEIIWPENPRPPKLDPFPYQELALKKVIKNYTSGISNKQLIILATGLGKSAVFSMISKWIFENKKKPVLVLAHREELLEQAISEFSIFAGEDYSCEIEQSGKHVSMTSHAVMASVATLGRDGSSRINKFPKNYFGAIIIDEAHHSTSSTYQRIINYFMTDNSSTLLIGVTATPERTDEESLYEIFNTVAINMGITEGTKNNHLCPIVSYRISSKTDLSQVRTTAGDFNLKDLADTVNNKERNTLIVETYTKRFPDKQALIFATDLDHVYQLRSEFQSIGISAEGVSGDMPKDERKKIIDDFKNKKVRILINYNILTEGFNYKELELIIQARPTKSKLLLTQILGRSTRKLENKNVSHIVEIIDNHSEKTATASSIFGFIQSFDCEGHHFLECIQKADSMILEKDYFNPYNCASWSEMLIRFERSKPNNPKGFDGVFDIPTRGPKLDKDPIYSEFKPNYDYYDSRYRFFYFGKNLKLLHTDRDSGFRYQIIAMPNGLGGYDVTMARKTLGSTILDPAERIVSFRGKSHADAIKKIEEYILIHYPDWDRLLWINAPWKKRAAAEQCSEKQYAIIVKNKLSKLPIDQISKRDASDMISALFSRNG